MLKGSKSGTTSSEFFNILLGQEMTLGDIQKFGSEIIHLGRQHAHARDE